MRLEPLLVHRLADLDFLVERLTDLVLDVLDHVALLVEDAPLQHVEHHPVLGKAEGVPVHGRTADTSAGRVEELGADEFLCIFLKVTLAALYDLTAGQGPRVHAAVAVGLEVGPLVRVGRCKEHRVGELDVADAVPVLGAVGGGD
ncbi:MAG: hypothetical protein A4E41_00162 [Methanoregulaceae archaeon PtaU1.Bin066]|nr:MAG: hypothetical protein A4E41_00162 [Methanoregulaceae archaeon PtaU1.Bin066]